MGNKALVLQIWGLWVLIADSAALDHSGASSMVDVASVTPSPFGSQTLKKIFVRTLGDYRDRGRETSVSTHSQEHILCKRSLKKSQVNDSSP